MNPQDAEERLDELTTRILVPLRTEKLLVTEALDELCELVGDQTRLGLFSGLIDARLAGKFWFVFCTMLIEAGHAREPAPIVDAAWRYQDVLETAFGPTWS
jgi:hypothetical protein